MRTLLLSAALLAVASLAQAGITKITCADDQDGVITMIPVCDDNPTAIDGVYNLNINCRQTCGDIGNVAGDITTNGDPTLKIIWDVTNDTTFAWTDYHITLNMAQPFSILNVSGPTGWNSPVITVLAGNQAQFDFYVGSGTPIAIGDDGIFSTKISFTGSTSYSTDQYPTPEPCTMALLGLGGLALTRRK